MQQSSKTQRIKTNTIKNIVGEAAWDMHLKSRKFHKTKRGQGGYKGAFRNLKEHELGVLLSAN